MKEADIKKIITDYLQLTGWLVIRMPPSIYSSKGIPDLYVLKGGRGIWLEVKSYRGKLTYEQAMFGRSIREHGGEWHLVMSLEDVIKIINKEVKYKTLKEV